jgi:CcmD family protein
MRRILQTITLAAVAAIAPVAVAASHQVFEPLAQQTVETVSAPPLILAAYGFVWAAVIVYVWMLWRSLGRVERELAEVNAKLAKR